MNQITLGGLFQALEDWILQFWNWLKPIMFNISMPHGLIDALNIMNDILTLGTIHFPYEWNLLTIGFVVGIPIYIFLMVWKLVTR